MESLPKAAFVTFCVYGRNDVADAIASILGSILADSSIVSVVGLCIEGRMQPCSLLFISTLCKQIIMESAGGTF